MKKRTYSEILDQIEVDENYIKEREEEERKRTEALRNKEIEDAVTKASQEAAKVVGNRLMLHKEHETYYEWTFRSIKNTYRCHIFAVKNEGVISKWELTEENGYKAYTHTPVNLMYLEFKLIEWVIINLREEGLEINE